MRLGEYLPWIIATASTPLFVSAVMPRDWPEHSKKAFRLAVAIGFFFLIGAYWLTTGEKFDETAYRWVLCKLHNFERCAAIAATPPADGSSSQMLKEAEALRKAADDLRREQKEATERRAKEDQERAARQRAEEDARKQEEERARTKAAAEAADAALAQREAAGDTAMDNAFRYWRQGNFKVAAEYSENALKVWGAMPNASEARVRNKIAEAHSIVGFGLALLGATQKDKSIGCGRLKLARKFYVEVGNSAQVSRVDQDLRTGGCA